MKKLLPNALLIEVRTTLYRQGRTFTPFRYYCTLIFEQINKGKEEILSDTYLIHNVRLIDKLVLLENIGKTVESFTKTSHEDGQLVSYIFTDKTTPTILVDPGLIIVAGE